ncbi:MAG: hypothetical protein P1P84_01455 [Deferrisomatales bacterium]|nr:hypothetical protein [Deferrisomatales bacterium]
MKPRVLSMILGLMCPFVFGAVSSSPAEERTVGAMSPWEASGEVFRIGPDRAQFMGKFEGILYVEKAEGQLDAALLLCPGVQTVDLGTGATQGTGHCIITSARGDQVFAEWSCSGTTGKGCLGEMRLTGGTGPFEGITGSGELAVRTALSQLTADRRSGEVVSHAAGLAVWPKLTYRIPER